MSQNDRLEKSRRLFRSTHPGRGHREDYPHAGGPGKILPATAKVHSRRRRPLDRTGGCSVTILEAAAALRAKKVSSLELTDESLKRIERANPRINAFITVVADSARARAVAMDAELSRGIDRGPLHGIPVAHKDLMMTRGVRTTGGSKLFFDFVPAEDAAVAEKWNDAGAVMAGKTGLHELAYGITSTNPPFG